MNFISYLRMSKATSTGEEAYGVDAQRYAINSFVTHHGHEIIAEYAEVQSGRKSARQRPELNEALAHCQRVGAGLIVGKIDRLARDVRFFLEVLDDYGVEIRFAEFPDINAKSDEGRMILIGLANFAEFEARRISTRTKAALAAAKARGVQLGGYRGADLSKAREASVKVKKGKALSFASSVYLNVKDAFETGGSLTAASVILNERGVKTSAGSAFCAKTVSRVLQVMR